MYFYTPTDTIDLSHAHWMQGTGVGPMQYGVKGYARRSKRSIRIAADGVDASNTIDTTGVLMINEWCAAVRLARQAGPTLIFEEM